MKQHVAITRSESAQDLALVAELFRRYAASSEAGCFKSLEEELASLAVKYGPPRGELLLARVDGVAVGCVALREWDSERCELKRLFVAEDCRGLGVGRLLVDSILAAARRLGYRRAVLDTFPERMAKAVRMYEGYGFKRIAPYMAEPVPGAVCFELVL